MIASVAHGAHGVHATSSATHPRDSLQPFGPQVHRLASIPQGVRSARGLRQIGSLGRYADLQKTQESVPGRGSMVGVRYGSVGNVEIVENLWLWAYICFHSNTSVTCHQKNDDL